LAGFQREPKVSLVIKTILGVAMFWSFGDERRAIRIPSDIQQSNDTPMKCGRSKDFEFADFDLVSANQTVNGRRNRLYECLETSEFAGKCLPARPSRVCYENAVTLATGPQ
jgi:hypothetical protein